ncbi:ABC transporter permease [Colidextribacter sp. 210702-DFI.3.9]|uniref:ABC transporter permease n=1 Tax=Flintibacter faecis TaxID=2763047 RepID=A0A8J6J3X0_9FIRM|nr:ABC transporter permease [Flintibacter faecis]MBC5717155.1 ABC transporter permease [Flintibacter faecis]MCB6498885.1 ABC transporter permease [Colidextribacter sp. 210702-DFI.3.9]MCG4468532.1 ABC transporter permease [Lawsonibacter sp. DFI.6.74]MCG4774323.1 ABC transporter permease [Lawsonibacter sp. DFI.5.51]
MTMQTVHDILRAVAVHLGYTVVSVSVGFVLGVALGIVLSRFPRAARFILPALSVLNTVPGIVFIGLLFLWLGMRPVTVLAALSIYAAFPVLKNTVAGLAAVEPQYKEAARGCGMDQLQRLRLVELPLAMPTIIGGLRLSTVYTVSWAVLAAMIGQGGLGDFIYKGVSSNNHVLILQGAIPAALLAFLLGSLVDALQKRVVPRGMRSGKGAAER